MNLDAGPSWAPSSSTSSSPSTCLQFHSYHGDNIVLLRNRTVAYRRASFADGIVFSSRPLWPNELFLLEIDRNENGWSGHMRLGLTSVDPNLRSPLPHYALPDLNASGRAWVYAITRHRQRVYDGLNGTLDLPLTQVPLYNYSVSGYYANNAVRSNENVSSNVMDDSANDRDQLHVVVNRNSYRSNNNGVHSHSGPTTNNGIRLPTDVGSQIGVYYRVAPDGTAEMHYVVNGIDQGPSATGIPYNGRDGPRLYALVDVYGSTKQVRIVQLAPFVAPLQHLCRICILKYVATDTMLDILPLPEKLKAFLRFKETNCRQRQPAVSNDDVELFEETEELQGD